MCGVSSVRATSIPFVDLARQHAQIRDEIDTAMAQVVDDGAFILGPDLELFETEWADFCEAQYAIGVGSGTAAIHLALEALGVGIGDEVVVPTNTFVATVFPVVHRGARPVLVDCDPVSATIDVDAVSRAVTSHTRAVIAVHLYGQPADMEPLLELAAHHGFDVLEDACQAHGARYRGRRVGALGRAGCFSFYPSKNLGALGDGGAVVTNDAELAGRLRKLRDLGQARKYEHVIQGYNERLDTLQAAVLRVKLRYLDQWNEARRHHASQYADRLAGTGLLLPETVDGREHVWHLYVVRGPDRDGLRASLDAVGIQTGLHYPVPVHLQVAFESLGYDAGAFPIAEQWSRNGLSLPMFAALQESEVAAVARALDASG
jgi:dTDP-4-amino-4,6-dideoxygalactose transaminase